METTRRRFLGGLAVASALTGTAAHAALASSTGENPDLIRMGAEFEAAQERFLAAADRVPAFQNAFWAIAPARPSELIAPRSSPAWRRGFADYAIDAADPNYARIKDERGNLIEVVQSYRIEAQYGARFDYRNPQPADFSVADEDDLALYRLTKEYEQAIDAALSASGLAAALEEYRSAQGSLGSIINELCQIRAKTLAGVSLKIRATAAYAAFGSDERFTATQLLARAVWEDMGEDA